MGSILCRNGSRYNCCMPVRAEDALFEALERFSIELPSWGFANTGTRFGKFWQAAAATSIEEKFSDAGQVHRYTGCCPTVAVHVLWDFPQGKGSAAEVAASAARYGIAIGSINPNVFQDQIYKYGSLGNPDLEVRRTALRHILDCIEIAGATGSRDVSLWFADGSSYPGTANIRQRRQWFMEGLQEVHRKLQPAQRMLVEYKPFEPAFYHTDIADWGMALSLARHAGSAGGCWSTPAIITRPRTSSRSWRGCLAEGMLGGFHFNDRRYADDDLTLGSIDPYQVFRIFHEIALFEWETGARADIAYMIDQSHNLKEKIEEMIQTVVAAQELYAKAALVDREALSGYQANAALVDAEECLKSAFATDVRPIVRDWRRSKGLAEDPLQAFRGSGYLEEAARERAEKNRAAVSSYA